MKIATIKQIGQSLGVTHQAVSKEYIKKGFIVRNAAGKIDIENKQNRAFLKSKGADFSVFYPKREADTAKPEAKVTPKTTEVKAESDICCTSSNAVKVIQSLGDRQIIYLPDQNLARYAAKLLDRELILWKGYCYVHHEWIKLADVLKLKEDHTEALVVAHPECTLDVLDISDHIGSTSGILKFVKDTDAEEFIVLTEMGMGHRLHKENPGKKIYMLEQAICANMKLTTLLSLYKALKYDQHHITVPEPTASRARRALERMMEII